MNKKKKIAITITSLSLLFVVAIGASLAYFTDKDNKENTVTMGNIDISLKETMEENGKEVPYKDPVNVKPGQTVSKIPNIKNESGINDCYVRAIITITNPKGADPLLTIADLNIAAGWNVVSISANSWYCYCNSVIAPNAIVQPFTKVLIPEKWSNIVSNTELKIDIVAEAIQADNFTPEKDGANNITAWKFSDGSFVTPETYVKK
ncbi:MAG: TasA family protein [Lachnospiraceae bacterium]